MARDSIIWRHRPKNRGFSKMCPTSLHTSKTNSFELEPCRAVSFILSTKLVSISIFDSLLTIMVDMPSLTDGRFALLIFSCCEMSHSHRGYGGKEEPDSRDVLWNAVPELSLEGEETPIMWSFRRKREHG